ncbi:hypothetical protein BDBG_05491 [Blastomyces gilchristii SLH14081]|uniref:Uncharacterized protein n=1 Tax=Blastomyces gilchristii (strain SLH14081) TaxID=559298 RepID=A0A179UTP0_BLAGS|nr:uncharacterized protein BDBG_05491 [Blastomyces gilchristii SLH14081]OAT09782.1 hypothetical protein BDBG_05491 [Blastomyces gilchristii SLH14081]
MPFENLDISIIPKSYLFPSTIPSDRSPCFGFRIEPLTESGVAGEVTVALLPTRDLAGVHNAIGITYQTPHSGTVLWSRLNTSIPSHGHSRANRPSPSPNSSPRNSIPTLSRAGGSHIYCIQSPRHPLKYFAGRRRLETSTYGLQLSVQSSWYLGGNIIAGASRGGVPLAKKLRAECWIGAHDEEKISGGVIMKFSQE